MSATTTAFPRLDPGVTYERCFQRLQDSERLLAEYQAKGWAYLATAQRKRIAGLKATMTRIRKQYWGMDK